MYRSLATFALLLAFLLVVVLTLPALDHHAAERVPGHQHLRVASPAPTLAAGRVAAHIHTYERNHTHHHGLPGTPEEGSPDSTVALSTPQAGMGNGGLPLAMVWLAPSLALPHAGGMVFPAHSPQTLPHTHTTPPPERPPITAL